ncbi:MAG: type I-E CRISPR-associated endonuclease Cas1 [Chloroflexi bacterium]|nr:type I-E CRISPR-associated endonuclease Cas1 [Chloroflexota bacterium]
MPRDLHELPKLRDSLSFLYVERCRIEQEEYAIALWNKEGRTPVPVAALGVLMLGPGTVITHAAVRALADNGCSIMWLGEEGVRFYACGTGETRKAYRLIKQAELVCDPNKRIEVVWRMYELRFGHRLGDDLSLNQIRGMEGARMRDAYHEAAERYGVEWHGRKYDRNNWAHADPINRALSSANACLNGIAHAAIISGGYSPGLGFIHQGKQLSFVYDIADLYKTEITIPLAFGIVAESTDDVEARARLKCRDIFREHQLLKRILPTIDALLDLPTTVNRYVDSADGDVDADAALPTGLWERLWQGIVED